MLLKINHNLRNDKLSQTCATKPFPKGSWIYVHQQDLLWNQSQYPCTSQIYWSCHFCLFLHCQNSPKLHWTSEEYLWSCFNKVLFQKISIIPPSSWKAFLFELPLNLSHRHPTVNSSSASYLPLDMIGFETILICPQTFDFVRSSPRDPKQKY